LKSNTLVKKLKPKRTCGRAKSISPKGDLIFKIKTKGDNMSILTYDVEEDIVHQEQAQTRY